MKNSGITLFFIQFVLVLTFTHSSLFAQNTQSTPVLHLAFENSVVDSSGLNPSIDVDGGDFVEDRNGNANSAFYFDGVDDVITIADTDNALDGITELSFMGWVKYEGFDAESHDAIILERFDSYDTKGYYFGVNRDGNLEVEGYTAGAGLEANEWKHIAFVIGEGIIKFFLNGELIDKASILNEEYLASNSDITIGLSEFSNSPFQGSLDDIKMYDYAVNDSVVRSNAGLEPIPDYSNSKILDMSFNQNLNDSSIAGNEVIESSGAFTEGRFGDNDFAYSFLGNDSHVNLKFEEPESAFSKIEDFTITAWIKINSFNNTESIIIQKPSVTESIGYETKVKSRGFKYSIDRRGLLDLETFSAVSATFGSARVLPQNEWVHIATTVRGHEVRNYINGELREARTTISRSAGIDFKNTSSINIGNDENGEKPFNGSIDALKVFNYALTQEEIAEQIDYEYITPVPEPRMLMYLPFDSESGSEEILPGNYEETGTVKVKDRFGEEDRAVYLNSDSTDIILKNTNASLDSLYKNISLSAWIRIDDFSYRPTIISRSDSTFGDGFRLALEEKNAGGGHTLYFSLNGISIEQRDFSIQKGNWVHVAGTYDGEMSRIYVNGRLIKEDSVKTKLSIQDPNIYIGQNVERNVGGGISKGSFIGKIDDVRIHNYAISSDSISAYYENRFSGYPTEPKSVLSLAFDGSIVDSSTAGNTIENIGATFGEDRFGDSDSAISFDGEDDKLVINDTDNALDSVSTGLTISTWVKMEGEYSGSYPGATLVERNDGEGYQYGFKIRDNYYYTNNESPVETVVFKVGGAELTFRDSPVQPGEWFHVAGTFDGEEARLYLNGRMAKSQPYETIINISDTDLYIGNNAQGSEPFRGNLDDVQMYNYALSDSTIAEFYADRPQSETGQSPKQVLQLSFENSFEDSSRFKSVVIRDGGEFDRDRFQFEKSAYSFDGIDDKLMVSDTSSAIDSLGDGFTVSGWYFHYWDGESQAEFDTSTVMSAETIDKKDLFGMLFRKEIDENTPRRLLFNVGSNEISYTSQAIKNNMYWYHIAGTYDGSEMKLYVNGEMVGSKDITGSELLNEPVSQIFIGNNRSGSAPIYATLDEIQMYTYPLSEVEIASMVDIEIIVIGNETEPKTEIPSDFELFQNYPNPFNPTTNIEFSMPQAGNVSLKIYNTLGREVATLKNDRLSAGSHTVTFDAGDLSSGVYFYQLRYKRQVVTKKMLLIK